MRVETHLRFLLGTTDSRLGCQAAEREGIRVVSVQIPEPSSFVLLAIPLVVAPLIGRRRRS